MSRGVDVVDRAAAHWLHVGIVLTIARHGGPISPQEMARELGEDVGAVDLHSRLLHELGTLARADHLESVRGGDRRFYGLAPEKTSALARATGGDGVVALGRGLRSPLRLRLLRELAAADAPLSPRQLSNRLGTRLGATSYHVRYLEKLGYVELTHTTPVRGTLAHYYVLSAAMCEFMPARRPMPAVPRRLRAQPSTSCRAR